jgi:hypothetical protein
VSELSVWYCITLSRNQVRNVQSHYRLSASWRIRVQKTHSLSLVGKLKARPTVPIEVIGFDCIESIRLKESENEVEFAKRVVKLLLEPLNGS